MESLKISLNGFKNIIVNVIEYVTRAHDKNDCSYSSTEEVDCDSDCSLCYSDSKSISLITSNKSKSS